jgi:hypothetical protein
MPSHLPYLTQGSQAQPAVGLTSAAPAQTGGMTRLKDAVSDATATTAAKDWGPPPDHPLQVNGLPVASSYDTGQAPAGSQRPSPRLERPKLGWARLRRRIGRMLPADRSCRLKLGWRCWNLSPHHHWQGGGGLAPCSCRRGRPQQLLRGVLLGWSLLRQRRGTAFEWRGNVIRAAGARNAAGGLLMGRSLGLR